MKILLVGADGKMGKMVRECAVNDEIIPATEESGLDWSGEMVDVVVDFSTCRDRETYINYAKQNKLPYACFSTDISPKDCDRFLALSKVVPVLICPNSSQGVNILFEIVDMISKNVSAEAAIIEIHHKEKKDRPSGTAKRIEEILKQNSMPFETQAFRVAKECGEHLVRFYLDDEIIEIKHYAKSRKIFALGALQMAKKLTKEKCGMLEKI